MILGIEPRNKMSTLLPKFLRYEKFADSHISWSSSRPRSWGADPSCCPEPLSDASHQSQSWQQSNPMPNMWSQASQSTNLSTGTLSLWQLFAANSNILLFQHLQTHAAFRPYVCSLCDAGFTSLAQLETHSRLHAKWTRQKQLELQLW